MKKSSAGKNMKKGRFSKNKQRLQKRLKKKKRHN